MVASAGLKPTHDLRVQLVKHRDGRRSYVVLDFVSGSVDSRADKFLSSFGEGTQRTYAYHLVDHLRWLAANGYREDSVTIQDLLRYLALWGAHHYGPLGRPWRATPLGESARAVRATCLKSYYLDLTTRENVNAELRAALSARRLPNSTLDEPHGFAARVAFGRHIKLNAIDRCGDKRDEFCDIDLLAADEARARMDHATPPRWQPRQRRHRDGCELDSHSGAHR